jgi:hypothetical protein
MVRNDQGEGGLRPEAFNLRRPSKDVVIDSSDFERYTSGDRRSLAD